MDRYVCALFTHGITSNTLASYKSGIRRYTTFCTQFGLQPLPLSDTNLCRFVTVLYQQQLSPSTIRLYLSSLRFLQISQGGVDPSLADLPRLHYIVRAVRRLSIAPKRPSRLPITPTILHHLYSVWSTVPVSYDNFMLWAACCLGFFAFLRAGEFTCPSWNLYTASMLSPKDIVVDSRDNPQFLVVTLRHSKTDIFGAGTKLYIGATKTNLCLVAAILAYLARRPHTPGGPLFLWENGLPLSRPALVEAVRGGSSIVKCGRVKVLRAQFPNWSGNHCRTSGYARLSHPDTGPLEIVCLSVLHTNTTKP
nr:site-specific integrase [Actinomycetes bacterium]